MKQTNVIFQCKGGCGKVFRQSVATDGCGNFQRPQGIAHAGEYDARPFARCECGKWLIGRAIVGKYNAEKGCDGRCMGATGPNCECACGGENHGLSYAG